MHRTAVSGGRRGAWLGRAATLLFAATGACMGLIHWVIAIRPRRKLRKRLEYDVEVIRAME